MRVGVFHVLIVITYLNSTLKFTDVPSNNEVTSRSYDVIFKSKKNEGNVYKSGNYESKCQLSVTWGGLSGGAVFGGFVAITKNFHPLNLLISSLLTTNFLYTYWLNNYIGFSGKVVLCGSLYADLKKESGLSNSILQFGGGIRWSYNGKGINRDNGRCYSGRLMINGMWGSFMYDSISFIFEPRFNRFGLSIDFTIFEMVDSNGSTLEVDLGRLDIGFLCGRTKNIVLEGLLLTNLFSIRISFGKSWWV